MGPPPASCLGSPPASSSTTVRPSSASRAASVPPPAPEPTTMYSQSGLVGLMSHLSLTTLETLTEPRPSEAVKKIKTPKNRHFSTARGFVGGAITVSHGASNGFVSPHAERLSISGIISHDLTVAAQ